MQIKHGVISVGGDGGGGCVNGGGGCCGVLMVATAATTTAKKQRHCRHYTPPLQLLSTACVTRADWFL